MIRRIAPILIVTILVAVSVHAATKYWSGPGTWTTGGGGNWSTTSGSGYGGASWAAGDSAVFEGTGGTVTLGEAISVSNITLNVLGYTFNDNSLNFVTNAVIDITPSIAGNTIFNCNISGSPDIRINKYSDAKRTYFTAGPGVTHTLGNIIHPYNGGGSGDKGTLYLGGTSTNNTAGSIGWESHHYGYSRKQGTGKWTVNGDYKQGLLALEDGTLIINGSFESRYAGISSIPSGTTLGGHLTLNTLAYKSGNGLNVNGGGTISPGDGGVGTITFHWGSSGTDRSFKMSDNAVFEWDVGADSNDVIDIVHEGGGNPHTLDIDNFVLKIKDAGGSPRASDQLPVFTYVNLTAVDMSGFGNTENNFDTTDVPKWAGGELSLVDDGSGTIYLTGLNKPPAGMVLIVR